MSRHDEPNEYGFAGGATAPEPPPEGRPDERDLVEAIAVPGDDLTEDFAEAMTREQEPEEPAEEATEAEEAAEKATERRR